MKLTERLLKAKHWQLFLITFGLPMVCYIIMMTVIFSILSNERVPDPRVILNFFSFFPIMITIFAGTLFAWLWALAVGLQKNIPPGIEMKTGRFKLFFFIPVVYLFLVMIGIEVLVNSIATTMDRTAEAELAWMPGVVAFVVPLHLLSMFGIFHCLYFVAKTIKTVELQRETTFSDFAGEFFMIWFYPIGVWIIQPRINKMIIDPDQTARESNRN